MGKGPGAGRHTHAIAGALNTGISVDCTFTPQTARLLTVDASSLTARERAFIIAICAASPDIAAAADLSRRFQCMICDRDAGALSSWLEDAGMGPMSSFARGILRDIDAVKAALTLAWSTGPVDGKIDKLGGRAHYLGVLLRY